MWCSVLGFVMNYLGVVKGEGRKIYRKFQSRGDSFPCQLVVLCERYATLRCQPVRNHLSPTDKLDNFSGPDQPWMNDNVGQTRLHSDD